MVETRNISVGGTKVCCKITETKGTARRTSKFKVKFVALSKIEEGNCPPTDKWPQFGCDDDNTATLVGEQEDAEWKEYRPRIEPDGVRPRL